MADTIRRPVTKVIDGDTFDIKVTHTSKNNEYNYSDTERIRITSIDAAELGSLGGYRDKERLEKAISGKEVRCYVYSRDSYGRVVAEVTIL
jgi:endonuclease YncB( thermonuclease family)